MNPRATSASGGRVPGAGLGTLSGAILPRAGDCRARTVEGSKL
jgi:hypothetical protein